jgi:hypothetical protein
MFHSNQLIEERLNAQMNFFQSRIQRHIKCTDWCDNKTAAIKNKIGQVANKIEPRQNSQARSAKKENRGFS